MSGFYRSILSVVDAPLSQALSHVIQLNTGERCLTHAWSEWQRAQSWLGRRGCWNEWVLSLQRPADLHRHTPNTVEHRRELRNKQCSRMFFIASHLLLFRSWFRQVYIITVVYSLKTGLGFLHCIRKRPWLLIPRFSQHCTNHANHTTFVTRATKSAAKVRLLLVGPGKQSENLARFQKGVGQSWLFDIFGMPSFCRVVT